MDKISPEKRSENMRRIQGKDTAPEKMVRSLIHRMGYRFRLHARNLPGKPDLVFSGRKRVIFVHGCFWHHHENCPMGAFPKSRLEFWVPKLLHNRERDLKNIAELKRLGWKVMVIWQCELSNFGKLHKKLVNYFR